MEDSYNTTPDSHIQRDCGAYGRQRRVAREPVTAQRRVLPIARTARRVQRARRRSHAAAQDVAGRKRTDVALGESETFASAVLESLAAHIAVVDRHGTIIAVNDAWCRFGAERGVSPPSSILAGANYLRACEAAAYGGDQDARRALVGIRQVLAGELPTFSMEYGCSSSTYEGWFLMTVRALKRAEGGAVVSHQNVTARKRAEIEVELRRQELAHLSRVTTMGELAASIAHELNQPLTGALTNAQAALRYLALEVPDIDEVREILHDIAEDTRRAGEVIRRLRSMLETGAVEPADVDLNLIAAEVIKLVGGDAKLNDVSLELEFTGDLPAVRGDRIQLQQVLLNLVLNGMDAIKHAGSQERRLTIRTLATDGRAVRLEVSDSGPGIDHAKLGQIFRPFFTTKPEGMGMGLSIARSIAEAHGGQLWAANNPYRGATFVLLLPTAKTS